MIIRHSFYLLPLLFITCAIGCSRAEPPLITQAEFDQIQPGMTFEEVEKIIGGKNNSSGYTENGAVEQIRMLYSFINEDGSYIQNFSWSRLRSETTFLMLASSAAAYRGCSC